MGGGMARQPRRWNAPPVFAYLSLAVFCLVGHAMADALSGHLQNSTVFDPELVDAPGALISADAAMNGSLPPVDRDYKYAKDFRLDKPFSFELRAGESVLVPLAPIHELLFSDDATQGATLAAIGFELSTCEGKVATYVLMNDGKSQRFSSSAYQCVTLTHENEQKQQQVDLCPVVHAGSPIALRADPRQVKGFVLRAYNDANVVALLRSTKPTGAYQRAFLVDAPGSSPSSQKLNVTFRADATQLAFDSARTWAASTQPSTEPNTTVSICDDCEYALYAEMVPARNSSDVPPEPEHPPPPYCVGQNTQIKFTLPKETTPTGSPTRHVSLSRAFADMFTMNGDYRFVLVASLPASANNGHPAMLSFAPTRVSVTAPTHYASRFLLVFGVLALVAFLCVVAVKSELGNRLLGNGQSRSSDKPVHDDAAESVRLLAQAIAEQDAEEALDLERNDEDFRQDENAEDERESLLDVIRKTKAQQGSTPQPSPRQPPPSANLEGYHEIN